MLSSLSDHTVKYYNFGRNSHRPNCLIMSLFLINSIWVISIVVIDEHIGSYPSLTINIIKLFQKRWTNNRWKKCRSPCRWKHSWNRMRMARISSRGVTWEWALKSEAHHSLASSQSTAGNPLIGSACGQISRSKGWRTKLSSGTGSSEWWFTTCEGQRHQFRWGPTSRCRVSRRCSELIWSKHLKPLELFLRTNEVNPRSKQDARRCHARDVTLNRTRCP